MLNIIVIPFLAFLFLAPGLLFAQKTNHTHLIDLRVTPRLLFQSLNSETHTHRDTTDLIGRMTCIGGTACNQRNPSPLHAAECINVNFRNMNSDQRHTSIEWACSAPVPPGASISSWTVRCLSAHSEHPKLSTDKVIVIRGSCTLEYRLFLTNSSTARPQLASPSLLSSPTSPMGANQRNGTSSIMMTVHTKNYGARLLAAILTCTIVAVCLVTLCRHFCVHQPSPHRQFTISRRYHYQAAFDAPPHNQMIPHDYVVIIPKSR